MKHFGRCWGMVYMFIYRSFCSKHTLYISVTVFPYFSICMLSALWNGSNWGNSIFARVHVHVVMLWIDGRYRIREKNSPFGSYRLHCNMQGVFHHGWIFLITGSCTKQEIMDMFIVYTNPFSLSLSFQEIGCLICGLMNFL